MKLGDLLLLKGYINKKQLQSALGIGAGGVFGSGTEAAVKKFQKDNGLDVEY